MKLYQLLKYSIAIAVVSITLCSPLQAKHYPDFLAEANCLATNIYFEARGEPIKGQLAVAMVTLNRVADPSFPDSICDVVHEGKSKGKCQFSWYCDRKSDKIPLNSKEAKLALAIAITAMTTPIEDVTSGALYFHSRTHKQTENVIKIGNHVFY